jgi:hypothetical protein
VYEHEDALGECRNLSANPRTDEDECPAHRDDSREVRSRCVLNLRGGLQRSHDEADGCGDGDDRKRYGHGQQERFLRARKQH